MIWAKRVEGWQSRGLTAEEFAAELGVKAGTLRRWKWQLGWEARGKPARAMKTARAKPPRAKSARARSARAKPARPEPTPPPAVCFTEVVAARAQQPAPPQIEIVTESGLRIRVDASFDETTLRRVLDVVEGRA